MLRFKKMWFSPVFSTFLAHRLESVILVGFAILQVGLHWLGFAGWSCPIKAILGIPCPGCGLTLAMDELLHGHWAASIQAHAFAPLFLAAFLILFAGILLPENPRRRLVTFVTQVEIRTGITAWVLSSLMLYWCIRLFGLL
jgi:hypothetical protein